MNVVYMEKVNYENRDESIAILKWVANDDGTEKGYQYNTKRGWVENYDRILYIMMTGDLDYWEFDESELEKKIEGHRRFREKMDKELIEKGEENILKAYYG